MIDDVFRGYGVEVKLGHRDDFLKVKETLTRIGVSSKKDNTLYQSCHILHKRGRYAIIHFKELFSLDGRPSNFSESDVARRNTIANLLQDWGLVEIMNPETTKELVAPLSYIKIISHSQKNDWNLVAKYNIGAQKNINT